MSNTALGSKAPARGRPRRFDSIGDEWVKRNMPHLKTDRARRDFLCQIRALRLIEHDERCRWLFDRDRLKKHDEGGWKPELLTELGRFRDDDQLIDYAVQVSKLKGSTKELIAALRSIRVELAAREGDA